MSNTVIQLKYSNVTGTPPTLNVAEPAYSNVSNKLWIGDGTSVVAIGGKHYTDQIDAATSDPTGNTIVLRDSTGNASFNYITANIVNAQIDGTANAATQLETPRTISLSGDANGSVIFDGTADANITVDLTSTGVSSGHYGSTTQIPTFQVDTDGRLLSAANVDIATTLSFSADDGSANLSLLSETLNIQGGDGITSFIFDANNTVRVDVDNTVIKTDRSNQIISGDISITGNLSVTGNVVYHGADDLIIDDPVIVLANNNTSNITDIGFIGKYVEDATTKEKGLVHHAATNKWYLLENYQEGLELTNILNIANPTLVTSNLVANLQQGTVSNLTSAINVTDGGTGFRTANTGDLIYGTGTNTLGKLLKPATNSYLRMGSGGTPEWVDTIDVVDGGTGNTSFTANHVIIGNGTGALTTVGSSTEGHVLTINASGAPVFEHLSGGTF
jgi:hypothetical protein